MGAPPPAGPAVAVSDLPTRVASALVMAAAALLTAWLGGVAFGLFWGAVAAAVAYEWARVIGAGEAAVPASAPMMAALLAVAVILSEPRLGEAVAAARSPAGPAILVGLLCIGAAAHALMMKPGRRGWAVAGAAYASVLAVVPSALRSDPAAGLATILWLFALVWITDIAAYFGGRAIGGPKLWPRVSPKKTWSGFVTGVLCGTVAGLGLLMLFDPANRPFGLAMPAMALLTLVAAATSQAGDLAESAFKRHFGVKDSSNLIPGHGGVMDRIDGFWGACLLVGLVLGVRLLAGR